MQLIWYFRRSLIMDPVEVMQVVIEEQAIH